MKNNWTQLGLNWVRLKGMTGPGIRSVPTWAAFGIDPYVEWGNSSPFRTIGTSCKLSVEKTTHHIETHVMWCYLQYITWTRNNGKIAYYKLPTTRQASSLNNDPKTNTCFFKFNDDEVRTTLAFFILLHCFPRLSISLYTFRYTNSFQEWSFWKKLDIIMPKAHAAQIF